VSVAVIHYITCNVEFVAINSINIPRSRMSWTL